MSRSLTEEADDLLLLALEEPDVAVEQAEDLRRRALASEDLVAESMALRALGLAARVRAEVTDAVRWLDAAVGVAAAAGELDVEAEARVSLSSALVYAGETDRALAVLDECRPGPRVAAIVAADRAAVLALLGRYDEALSGLGPVIGSFRSSGDRRREARALTNRGLLSVYTGRFARADEDLARAEALFESLQLTTEAAGALHNRAFAASRKGDVAVALDMFQRAERRYEEVRMPGGSLALDRAEALLMAGLVDEAGSAATSALSYLRENGHRHALAEGLLLAADAAFLGGDLATSSGCATEASTLFAEQSRPTWEALADAKVARAVLESGRAGAAVAPADGDSGDAARVAAAETASSAARGLRAAGLQAEAVDAHATAGELWLLAGSRERADADLASASDGRRLPTARARAAAWEAEGVRRLGAGDRRGAVSALRTSLRTITEHQASLGASELRSSVAVHAERTAGRGLRLAIEGGRPREILDWMERRRAGATLARPVRPPLGQPLAGWLDELRALAHQVQEGAMSGADVRELLRRQARLEEAVRTGSWAAGGTVGRATRPDRSAGIVARLVESLGERALLELAVLDGSLHAVVVAGRRSWYRRLGPVDAVTAGLEHVRFSLRSGAYGLGDGGALEADAAALDDLLLGPLRGAIGDRELVVVPTGTLHAVPWGLLPTLSERPVAVAPSARAWLRATDRTPPGPAPARVLVVAGPGLDGARVEAEALRARYPAATLLAGPEARSGAVLAALQSCDIAHIAAHATFRADNGLWSSIHLDDGPLSVYELEDVGQAPAVVVLSACQSGLSAVRPGDEVLGLVAGMLAAGARSVIASVVPVADEVTAPFMLDLHQRLAAGEGPAAALAGARSESGEVVAASSFVCFGAG